MLSEHVDHAERDGNRLLLSPGAMLLLFTTNAHHPGAPIDDQQRAWCRTVADNLLDIAEDAGFAHKDEYLETVTQMGMDALTREMSAEVAELIPFHAFVGVLVEATIRQ